MPPREGHAPLQVVARVGRLGERDLMATLKDVKVGESATVAKLNGTGALKRRIMDMGLTKGTRVYVKKVAPLGDPIELTVRGYELSIRRDEAANVDVTDVATGE